jgi:hypothetical protein
MSLVAERQRLRRSRVLGDILGHFELRSGGICSRCASGWLLSVEREPDKQQNRQAHPTEKPCAR